MFKKGVILMMLMAILATSISCISCQTGSEPVPTDETPAVLAPSPAETTDGSLVGDGWEHGQTPQSYNTGENQVPASEEEVQRVKKELEELESDDTIISDNKS
jgi:hypothetical protein